MQRPGQRLFWPKAELQPCGPFKITIGRCLALPLEMNVKQIRPVQHLQHPLNSCPSVVVLGARGGTYNLRSSFSIAHQRQSSIGGSVVEFWLAKWEVRVRFPAYAAFLYVVCCAGIKTKGKLLECEGPKAVVRSGIRTHASRGDCYLNAAPQTARPS